MKQQMLQILLKSNGKVGEKVPTLGKSEAQIKRQKKRKMAAFKSFFIHAEPEQNQDPLIKRKMSDEHTYQQLQPDPRCKICQDVCNQKRKECKFCHEIVCNSHFRKKRRDGNNKFVRICDHCEDQYIYKKNLKNQMKVEETLAAQEFVLQSKVKEIQQIAKGKRAKLNALEEKAIQLHSTKIKEEQRYTNLKVDLEKLFRKLQLQMCQLSNLQGQLIEIQKKSPPSLQSDNSMLVQQNEKITKQLLKHQKWCNDIIKARNVREKKMYEEYYEWQLMQKNKRAHEKKQDQCDIY